VTATPSEMLAGQPTGLPVAPGAPPEGPHAREDGVHRADGCALPDHLEELGELGELEELEELLGAPLSGEVLKRKEGRRSTWRIRGSHGTAILKWYATDRAPRVAERILALRPGPTGGPLLPTLLFVAPRAHLVVLTEVPGKPLGVAARAGDQVAFHRAGRSLGRWHRGWAGRVPPPLRAHTADRERSILLERAVTRVPELASAVAAAAALMADPWTCSTVVHRDLYEEQILVGEEVGLIDLDDAAAGPPELDLGNLAGHLDLLALVEGVDSETLVAAFLGGYGAMDVDLFERCRALTRLRLACIHRRPELLDPAPGRRPGRRTSLDL
jgi:hypothetical protein